MTFRTPLLSKIVCFNVCSFTILIHISAISLSIEFFLVISCNYMGRPVKERFAHQMPSATCALLVSHSVCLHLQEDEEGINPLIKVWNLDKVLLSSVALLDYQSCWNIIFLFTFAAKLLRFKFSYL